MSRNDRDDDYSLLIDRIIERENPYLPSDFFNLSYIQLSGEDLSKLDMRRIILSFGNFYKANFYRSRLTDAVLISADMCHCNLQAAHLERANLKHARLRGANLVRAHLQGANLMHADLRDADLSFADLSDANLSYAELDHAIFRQTKMSGAIMSGVVLDDVQKKGIKLE